jgi:hypothetical protein
VRRSSPAQAVAFALAAIIASYYALRGGSYDIVVRQEAALVVWFVVGLGYGLGFLPRSGWPRGALVPLAAITLLAAWTAISLSWSDSHERTVAELARVLAFAGVLLLAWGLVDRTTWRPAAAGLALAAVFVCGLAVASRLWPDAFPANEVKETLGTNRLSYPFNYWNAVGAWGAMSIAMAVGWSAHARALATRAACLAAVPVCALAVYLSYSRAGVIGTACGLLAVWALSSARFVTVLHVLAAAGGSAIAILAVRDQPDIVEATGGSGAGAVVVALLVAGAICAVAALGTTALRADRWRAPKPYGAIAAGIAGVALAVAVVAAGGDLIERAWDQFREQNTATVGGSTADPAVRLTSLGGGRYLVWESALRAYEERPWQGIGAGTFEFWWNQDEGEEFMRDAHSLYLESLAELGIPGLALVVILLGGLGAIALRARPRLTSTWEYGAHAGLGAAFVVYLVQTGVDWLWESTAITLLGLLVAAVAAAPRTRPLPAPRALVRAGIAVVAVIACLLQLPGLVSTSLVRDSQDAIERGDVQAALGEANDAVEAQPWAASPYAHRALVEEEAGRLAAAAVDMRSAIDREPNNWRHPLLLARIEARRGRVKSALQAYRRARRLRPESRFFQ